MSHQRTRIRERMEEPQPRVVDQAFLAELTKFLALECPFLIDDVLKLGPATTDPRELQDGLLLALDARLKLPPARELWPFVSSADAVGWTRELLAEQVAGFFRRQEIKASITPEERALLFRQMTLTREVDTLLKRLYAEKKIAWKKHPSPQKGFRSLGQEAIVGAALRLRHGDAFGLGESYAGDVCAPLLRDLGVLLAWTDGDVENALLAQVGKKGGPMDGRDFYPGDFDRGVLPASGPLGIPTQTAVGIAYGFKLDKSDRVCVSFIGDGGSSLGEWHEAVNFAAVQRLNVIFFVENNQWALGTHGKEQTVAKRFALKAAGYGIPGITIFGNDPEEIAAAAAWAAERARAEKGPALIELVTYRRAGYAHHDDERYSAAKQGYELEDERVAWEDKDPIALYERKIDRAEAEKIRKEAAGKVQEAASRVESAPWPGPDDFLGRACAPRMDAMPAPEGSETFEARRMGYDEAIRTAMEELMDADPRVFLLGEDIGGRYGGAFGVTRNLAKRFGSERCLNAILAESAILGCGIGAALVGKRAIVEIQFADFVAGGFNAMVNSAPKIFWRYGKRVPLVVRLPYGASTGMGSRLLGGGPLQSQCPEAWFLRVPGWKIVAPASPLDAKGLLTAAVRDGNPVIFLEAKGLYAIHRPDLKEAVPLGLQFEVPIGKAAIRREGKDVSCLTYGAMVWTALEAAEKLAPEGISVEVVDLRTLAPLDEEAILKSVKKTGRALILHEDVRTGGPGAELAAIIAEKALSELDAPVVRVTAPDTPVPYAPPLEHAYLPKVEDVVRAAKAMVK